MPYESKVVNHAKGPMIQEEAQQIIAQVDDLFKYHPWNDEQAEKGNVVRAALREAYHRIVSHVEPGPMRTRALNMLTDCRMLANQAITFPGQ